MLESFCPSRKLPLNFSGFAGWCALQMQRNITAKALASQAFFRTWSREGALACREIFATSKDRGVRVLARRIEMHRGIRREYAAPEVPRRCDKHALRGKFWKADRQ